MISYQLKGGNFTPGFQHQVDISSFLVGEEFRNYHGINFSIYNVYNRFLSLRALSKKRNRGFWNPLNFLNVVFDQIDIIKREYERPLTVKWHIESLRIPDFEKYVLISAVTHLFRSIEVSVRHEPLEDEAETIRENYRRCFLMISKMCKEGDLEWDLKIPQFPFSVLGEFRGDLPSIKSVSGRNKPQLSNCIITNACEEAENETIESNLVFDHRYTSVQVIIPSEELTVVQYALFYYYLQEGGYFPNFGNFQKSKKNAYKYVARYLIINQGSHLERSISADAFRNAHYKMSKYEDRLLKINNENFRFVDRQIESRIADLKKVIGQLTKFPKALKQAKEELEHLLKAI